MGPLEWDSEDETEPLVQHHMHRMVYCDQPLDKIERLESSVRIVTMFAG